MSIRLREEGRVILKIWPDRRVELVKSSGYKRLDQEALRALKEALENAAPEAIKLKAAHKIGIRFSLDDVE